MMTDDEGLFSRLRKYDIKPIKSLGQNFLTDNNIINKIINAADISSADFVIEIGPGGGSLTGLLAEKAGALAAIEIDGNMIPLLSDLLSNHENTTLINKDILDVDIKREALDLYPDYNSYKVVANLPYYITTPIIMKFLESDYPPEQMTVMMQKEVAARLNASPGNKDYGSLTVSAGVFCNIQKVCDVSRNCFYPKPDVESTVLTLTNKGKDILKGTDRKLFFDLVRASFSHRRKKMSNSIANSPKLGISRAMTEDVLDGMGLGKDIRAEKLSLEQFVEFSTRIKDC